MRSKRRCPEHGAGCCAQHCVGQRVGHYTALAGALRGVLRAVQDEAWCEALRKTLPD